MKRSRKIVVGALGVLLSVGVMSWLRPEAQAEGSHMALPQRLSSSSAIATSLAGTITVNITADTAANDGFCSLREAITAANTNTSSGVLPGECAAGMVGLDSIVFAVGGGTPTINVMGSPLPTIIEPVVIDGNTGGSLRVALLNGGAGYFADGLTITAGGSTIRGLVIYGVGGSGIVLRTNGGNVIENCHIGVVGSITMFGVLIDNSPNNIIGGATADKRNVITENGLGVLIRGSSATGNKVIGNYLGTDVTGTLDFGSSGGVFINNAPNNIIGGTTSGERNLISGSNSEGVTIFGTGATGNKVIGNYIGTDVTGLKYLGNNFGGVRIQEAPNNIIGGTTAGERNIISGNYEGVELIGDGATGNRIIGNYIGTDVTGTTKLRNNGNGVVISFAPNNIIGGTTPGERNLISGNDVCGVSIIGSGSTGNSVTGNFIGTDVNGLANLGNQLCGVGIDSASNNIIGGTTANERNLISGNNGGVMLTSYLRETNIGNRVLGNSIFNNASLGIDLFPTGVTANDPGDPDTGPNNLQNFPLLTAVSSTTILGTLDSLAANASYPMRLEFFANTVSNTSGKSEGEVFLGATSVAAPGAFSFNYTPVFGKPFISATATDSTGNTSEFSPTVAPAPTVTIANPFSCTGPGNSLTVSVTISNLATVAMPASFSVTALPAGLIGLSGSGTSTVGAPPTVTATSVMFNVTLAAGQIATATYQVQVIDTATSGTQFCITTMNSFGNVTGVPVQTCATINCPAAGPGALFPVTAEVSGQKAGSVLVYNLYSSSVAAPNTQNTRVSLTNTHPTQRIAVHLFFVDGATCSIADSLICLTPNQTASFLSSDIDPGTTGYIVAVASDLLTGCPVNFNFLIGDEFVKLSSGHAANLAAESFAALAGGLPLCDANSPTAVLNFDGVSYNRVPRVLASSNIPSRADGNDTLLVLNRLGGNLATGAATLSSLFGIFYDDAEQPFSFSFNPGVCQLRSSLSNSFPRTTPRLEQIIPAGRSGWAKFYSLNDQGLLGAVINFNPNATTAAGAFNQGRNLHKLALTSSAVLTIPIFPPNC